jgi:large subunit ribosomal protein L19
MTNALMASLQPELKADFPDIGPGDTVRVHQKIVEGRNERIQVFQGVVISVRGGKTPGATYIVRRTAAHGVGVERTFPLYSTSIDKVEVLRKAKVRRAQLYYLRERQGKSARLREQRFLKV